MSNDYTNLAPVYDRIGLGDFALRVTPQIVGYAQRRDWAGRQVLDLGCGTGASTRWFANQGYAVTAVDCSEPMIKQAQRALPGQGLSLSWRHANLLELDPSIGRFDLVVAIDVINEFANLRDLEQICHLAQAVLEPGQVFAFDMHTIQGLTERGMVGQRLIYEDAAVMASTINSYDHDRQTLQKRYIVFQREGDLWRRGEMRRVVRGYPVQAMATLLQRSGLELVAIVNADFEPFDLGVSRADRVIFFARKPGG